MNWYLRLPKDVAAAGMLGGCMPSKSTNAGWRNSYLGFFLINSDYAVYGFGDSDSKILVLYFCGPTPHRCPHIAV